MMSTEYFLKNYSYLIMISIMRFFFSLIVLEMNYKMKSEESLAAGLGDSNEYLILVNPLREAIYWYIHRVLISDRKILFSKKRYVPSLGEEYSFVEYVLQLHDEF